MNARHPAGSARRPPSLIEQIESAEQAVILRDMRVRRTVELASRQAHRTVEKGGWLIGGTAALAAGWLIRRWLRRGPPDRRSVHHAPAPQRWGPSILLSLATVLPLLLSPSGARAPRLPLWMYVTRAVMRRVQGLSSGPGGS